MASEFCGQQPEDLSTIEQILTDPAASEWLKDALRSALSRDPVDAANDAEVLAKLLDRWCQGILKGPSESSSGGKAGWGRKDARFRYDVGRPRQ